MQTCYFEYCENARSYPSIIIVSPCRKLWCPKCSTSRKLWCLICMEKVNFRPTLKSCLFPIHQLCETKNGHKLPAGRNIFFAISLSKKILYNTKDTIQWKCYFVYICIQFLCSIFLLIHRNLIVITDINQRYQLISIVSSYK